MEALLELCKTTECGLEIIGKEEACEQYASEFLNSNKDFTYLLSITINLITKFNTNEEAESVEYLTVNHLQIEIEGALYNDNDIAKYIFNNDGLYRIVHMILPTKEWFDAFIEANSENLDEVGSIFYYNDGKVYLYSESTSTEVALDDIFELNSTLETISFVTTELYTFSICNLQTCFYTICKNLLNNLCSGLCSKTSDYSNLIYARDMLWMSINVIKYLLLKGNYFEALRILNLVTGCTGFCNNNINTSGGLNCGCHSNN